MRGDPAREAFTDRHPKVGGSRVRAAQERALERDRLARPLGVVHAIDADRVVVDQAAGLADEGPGDAVEVLEMAQPTSQLGDGGRAGSASVRPELASRALPMAVAM